MTTNLIGRIIGLGRYLCLAAISVLAVGSDANARIYRYANINEYQALVNKFGGVEDRGWAETLTYCADPSGNWGECWGWYPHINYPYPGGGDVYSAAQAAASIMEEQYRNYVGLDTRFEFDFLIGPHSQLYNRNFQVEMVARRTDYLDKSNLGEDCGCTFGDPIHAATGNIYMPELDYRNPTDPQLSFYRYYNSLNDGGTIFPLGWTSSFSQNLLLKTNVLPAALAIRPDGKRIAFAQSDNGWISNGSYDEELAKNGNEWFLKVDNSIEVYNATGQLTSIVHLNGRGYQASYTNNSRSITDGFGRGVKLVYGASMKVSRIEDLNGNVLASYSVVNPDPTLSSLQQL